jgi:hypothetical protein
MQDVTIGFHRVRDILTSKYCNRGDFKEHRNKWCVSVITIHDECAIIDHLKSHCQVLKELRGT